MICREQYAVFLLKCDGCQGRQCAVPDAHETVERALEAGLAEGWHLDADAQLCPACAMEPCS